MSKLHLASLAAITALCLASLSAGQALAANSPNKCPVVSFGKISSTIGALKFPGSGFQFQPWGDKPGAGIWLCQATSATAFVAIGAHCHVPYVRNLFYQYEHGVGKGDDQWYKVSGLGDQAYYIVGTRPDKILGRSAGLSVRKGKTMYQIVGSVGNPKKAATLVPMPKATLMKLARMAIDYKCP